MPTNEIPRNRWTPYMDEFTERHAGQAIRLEIMQDSTVQLVFDNIPLRGIACKLNAVDDENITVSAGGLQDIDAMHVVRRPTHVQVATTAGGADEGLLIETASGSRMVLSLTPAPAKGHGAAHSH